MSEATFPDCVHLRDTGVSVFQLNDFGPTWPPPRSSHRLPPSAGGSHSGFSARLPGPISSGSWTGGPGDQFSLMISCTETETHSNNQGFYISHLSRSYFWKEMLIQDMLRPFLKVLKTKPSRVSPGQETREPVFYHSRVCVTLNGSLAPLASCWAKETAWFGLSPGLEPSSATGLVGVASSLWPHLPALKTGVAVSIPWAGVRTTVVTRTKR